MADAALLATQQELEEELREYVKQHKSTMKGVFPYEVNLANRCAMIGFVTGTFVGFSQQLVNGFSLAFKAEKLPFLRHVKAINGTRSQVLGRMFLTGLSGSTIGIVYGAGYVILRSTGRSSEKTNLFLSGFIATTFGGLIFREGIRSPFLGILGGAFSILFAYARESPPPTLKSLRQARHS